MATSGVQWMIVLVFAFVVFPRPGATLRCWECLSSRNPMCGDPMNVTEHQFTFQAKQCEESPMHSPKPVCKKIVRKEAGGRLIIRSCSIPNNDEVDIVDGPCSQMTSGRDMIESCHICSTDLCNSATSLSVMPLLYGGAFVLLVYRVFSCK